jgi:hypothetical protein
MRPMQRQAAAKPMQLMVFLDAASEASRRKWRLELQRPLCGSCCPGGPQLFLRTVSVMSLNGSLEPRDGVRG